MPPASVEALRTGSTDDVNLAVNQLSGSIYPSLIHAEVNHLQTNLYSIRDRMVLRFDPGCRSVSLVPWVRGYGVAAEADPDDCLTPGYRHEIGGAELGAAISHRNGLSAFGFTHLAGATFNVRDVGHHAEIDSYRFGGGFQYVGHHLYLFAAGGAGTQDYDVRRSLTAFEGSTSAESQFDGDTRFGYLEVGTAFCCRGTSCNPYLSLQSARVELDAVTETGDDEFALSHDGSSGESLRGGLGVALERVGPAACGPARTRLRAGWLHEFLDESETISSQLAIASPTPITLEDRGLSLGRDWAMVGCEVDFPVLCRGRVTAGYQGHFNSRSAYSALLAGLQWVW
jgi:uncharacterized protein with beta-barrel porin domain